MRKRIQKLLCLLSFHDYVAVESVRGVFHRIHKFRCRRPGCKAVAWETPFL